MWKVAALAALLAISVHGQAKTRCRDFCTDVGKKETTCDVPSKCGLETASPVCTNSFRKVSGSYTLTAQGKLCTCGASGECNVVSTPDCANTSPFKDHKECNGGGANAPTVDQYCFPTPAAEAASPTFDENSGEQKYILCSRASVAGKCFAGYCLTPSDQEALNAPLNEGEDLESAEPVITTPSLLTFASVSGITVLVLQRPTTPGAYPYIDVEVGEITGWKFGALGPAGAALTPGIHRDPNPTATGFRVTIETGTATENQLIFSYAIPFVRIGSVDVPIADGMILIVVLPKINPPTIRGSGAVWKSGATVASATTPLANGDTKIALGHFITLEGAACDPFGWINAGYISKKVGFDEEVEEFWDLENFAEIQSFQFSKADAEPATKITITAACFGLYGDYQKSTAVSASQTWTVDTRPGKIAVAATTLGKPDLFLFAYQVRNPPTPPLYTLTEIQTVIPKIGDTFGLKSGGQYKDATDFAGTVFDQLKEKKITSLTDQIVNGIANLDTELDCTPEERAFFITDLQNLVELGDRDPSDKNKNLDLGDLILDTLGQFLELCNEPDALNETASASQSDKFTSAQSKKKTKSKKAKDASAAATPQQKLDTNKRLRKDALATMRSNLEQEISELKLVPGEKYQLQSKDPATKSLNDCWLACVVRQPLIKPKDKITNVCTIGSGSAVDVLKIKGDEKFIKAKTDDNKAKYPEDPIVGLLKFTGSKTTPQCNYEKTNKQLKSEGSYHVFVFDAKKLPAKGKPAKGKPKSTGFQKLGAGFHSVARKYASMSANKHASVEKFNVKQSTSWDFVVTPAQYDPATVACQIRAKDQNLQTAFLGAAAADGNGCVMGNSQNIGVDSSLILVPKSAASPPSKPNNVVFKSASKTTMSAVVLLVLAIVTMVL